ncbi:hypothetical protein Droror1_Dr00025770 [Drosera rotundifolia]
MKKGERRNPIGCFFSFMRIFSCCYGRTRGTIGRSRIPVANHDTNDHDHRRVSKEQMPQAGAGHMHLFSEMKRYSWEEIESMTRNFRKVIGVGGFSHVYLARLPNCNVMAAVKVYIGSERLNNVFRTELDISRIVDHPYIVKLIGYCDEREEGVLVFEMISNGTLHRRLRGRGLKDPTLPWKSRMAIAFQLAQALEYLHENCSLQIVHGDVKSSNILLDSQLNCKLCDLGSAKMGFASTMTKLTNLMGSPGYIDPHFLMTGIASVKNDIYSFGIILLELITGLEAFSTKEQKMLASIARRENNLDVEMVVAMADRRIIKEIDMEEAAFMASLAAVCVHSLPSFRPSAADVCRLLREKITSISIPSSLDKKPLVS